MTSISCVSSRRHCLLAALVLVVATGCDGRSGPGPSGASDGETSESGASSVSSSDAGDSDSDANPSGSGGDSTGGAEDSTGATMDGCDPLLPTLSAGQTVTLSSAGPGSTTGVFCILVPDDASMIAFHLEGGTCDANDCDELETVVLYFKEGDVPDHTNPDDDTKHWEWEVGGYGEFEAVVAPGPAYLVTDDGPYGLGYQGVSLRVTFDGESDATDGNTEGTEECERAPELDVVCPPGFPPAAYECPDDVIPLGCEPGAGPAVCCPE